MVTGEEGAEPGLVVEKPRSFYGNEAQWLGCQGVVMAAGVRGEMWEGWGGESLVSWSLPGLSGWTLLALETVRLLHTTPLGEVRGHWAGIMSGGGGLGIFSHPLGRSSNVTIVFVCGSCGSYNQTVYCVQIQRQRNWLPG